MAKLNRGQQIAQSLKVDTYNFDMSFKMLLESLTRDKRWRTEKNIVEDFIKRAKELKKFNNNFIVTWHREYYDGCDTNIYYALADMAEMGLADCKTTETKKLLYRATNMAFELKKEKEKDDWR